MQPGLVQIDYRISTREMHDILAQVKLAKPRYQSQNFITISTDFSKAVCSYRPEHSIPASPFHLRLEVTDLPEFFYARELVHYPHQRVCNMKNCIAISHPNQEYLFIENATPLIIWNFKKGACCKEKVRPTREYSTCSANSDYVLWCPDLNYSEKPSLQTDCHLNKYLNKLRFVFVGCQLKRAEFPCSH